MKNANWKSVAEVIGIGAIVASLVFVGVQIRQSHAIALSTQYQERANAASAVHTGALESDINLRLGGERLRGFMFGPTAPSLLREWARDRPPEDLAWQFHQFQNMFTVFDNNHFQYTSGFLDEGSWLAFQNRMTNVLRNPINRAMYKQSARSFRLQFREHVDAVVVSIEAHSS